MVAAAVLLYFFVIVLAVMMVVFPTARGRCIAVLATVLAGGATPVARSLDALSRMLRDGRSLAEGLGGAFRRYVLGHPWLCGLALMMVVAPSLLAFFSRSPAVFDFSDQPEIADRQIAILLEGERLIPPPPLPPEAFTTREVEIVRPDIVHASRNWQQLDEVFTQRLLVVFKLMKERHGYEMTLIEGYRSPERQAQLFAQGSHVTQVGANMSYHQYGLAADSAFIRDGRVVISERDPWAMRGYQLYGEVAEQVGLTWGGRWKMQDYGHVELRRKGVLGKAGGQ